MKAKKPKSILLVSGMSGGGKTTVLRLIGGARCLRSGGCRSAAA